MLRCPNHVCLGAQRSRSLLVVILVLLFAAATVLVGTAGPARAVSLATSCNTTTNVALNKTATASSRSGTQTAAKAVDGKTTTRWASQLGDPQWLQIDLGSRQNVCQVGLNWAAYASQFSIQVSDDAATWTSLITTGATSNTQQLLTVFGSGRYIRMYGYTRGNSSTGYSLTEFQVFTQPSEPPAFTSAATATFTVGAAGSFPITTSGVPAVSTIGESGTLPAGMTFTDNGNGTATLAGTPTGAGGTYSVSLTASNGISPNASQALTIQVNRAPVLTLNPTDQTVRSGTSVTFTAAASGVPAPAVQWQRSTDGGASFVDIAGATSTSYTVTAAAGDDGSQYRAVFSNVAGTAASSAAVLYVGTPPTFTSANNITFVVGRSGTFSVTTSGVPSATIIESGSLPPGVTFTDNGDGTATLAGTPAAGSGGSYQLTLTAANGFSPSANQAFTLLVNQPPAFTNPATATFVVGTAGSFTISTSGVPTVSVIGLSGTLPAGITFTDNGNGTATLSGTPTGTGGAYPVTLVASNGVSPNASQALTIQVNQAPVVTTNPVDQTVAPGGSVSFTAAASGVPAPTVQWQRSTDGGASFTNIAGATSAVYTFTAAAGDDGNKYRAVFTNSVGTATTTAATLGVGSAPAFTSADNTRFVVGTAGSFTITTTGVPAATLSRTGAAFPAWLTLTDNGDGTGALTGTPPAGSGGSYSFTLKAANGFGTAASQNFTLFVDQSPVITSADHATFTVGTAGSFAVTTTAGFPTTTGLSKTGSLPAGVTFTDNGDGTATLAGTPAAGTGGSYPITITATAAGGSAAAATQSFTLTVSSAPTITSADHATFSVGSAGSFTVTTAAGNPASTTLTKTGTLPAGVTFTDNGNGTATIAGTPNAGSGGVYTLTITASNGVGTDATQAFTLTVNQPPTITSPDHATFTLGTAAAFTVTTSSAVPSSVTLTKTGSLPPGMTFTDNGDGTATLGGTPSTGGSYTFTITASNGVLPDATQAFTATVNASPSITSADHTTFAVGSAGSFTVTTTPGVPATTTITESGSLPSGVSFTDNGDGTATLAGTPAAGTGGTYPITFTASNGVLPNSAQNFTLTVTQVPTISSVNHATFAVGSAGSFTVTTTAGFPVTTTITETGTLPAGVSFTDNGDGSATLAGTPVSFAAGSYPLTLTATNSVGHVDQAFTLTVVASAAITSADHTTFAVGSAGTFTVTTSPAATTITETGALPAGVTFTDNGDGTATLAGTPAAGTGGSYPITITASNGVPPNATQSFTLTVNEAPIIT
jgi:large repetitive protein